MTLVLRFFVLSTVVLLAGAVLTSKTLAADPQPTPRPFAIAQRIAGPDGGWDYAAVDADARHLYVARSYGVMALDLTSGAVVEKLVDGDGVHAVAPIPGGRLVLSSNGRANTALLFDGLSGKVEATIAAGSNPDAVTIEPKSGRAVIFNGKSRDASIYDLASKTVVATVALDGKPEFGVADGQGRVFVNIEDKARVAILDPIAGKLIGAYALSGCEEPSGLAFDARLGVLIVACANKVAKIIAIEDGKDLGSLVIGQGPDAVLLDAKRRRAFIPCAEGVMNVIALDARDAVKVVATVATQPRAKTGALDPRTGKVYLPAAKFAAPEKEGERPRPLPGTFEILVVSDSE